METYTVKGTHVIATKAWVDQRCGTGFFERTWKSGSADYPTSILAASKHDVYAVNRVMCAAAKQLNMSVEEVATKIAESNARKDLNTVYQAFLKAARPQLMLNATPLLWRTYVSFGEAVKITNEQGHYVGEGRRLPEELLGWSRGCWLGFIPTAIELAGGRIRSSSITLCRRHEDPAHQGHFRLQLEVHYDV